MSLFPPSFGPPPPWVLGEPLGPDVLLFATLFIFGDKKVVHDVSRQEAGRNQAGATARGTFAMPQRDQAMELVVSENFVPTMRSPWFVLSFFSFAFLEFKSNNIPSSCYATDEQTSKAAEAGESKSSPGEKREKTVPCGKRTRRMPGVLTRSRSPSWIWS